MENIFKIYNSFICDKEVFMFLNEGCIGMYVCGLIVYSDVYLGNCCMFISFDVIYCYLMYLGYKVCYVCNIIDVGYFEGDSDEIGIEDKIFKKVCLEELEFMEIVQKYINGFYEMMCIFNILLLSIELWAIGYILEQIKMVQDIIDNGYGYEFNGFIYFDILKFIEEIKVYGKLFGCKIEDLMVESCDNFKN